MHEVTPVLSGHSPGPLLQQGQREDVLDDPGQAYVCWSNVYSKSSAITGAGPICGRDFLWLVSQVESGQRTPA